MLRRFALALTLALTPALTAGCMGSASVYYQDTHGGVFALHDDQDKAMKDAHKKMAAHCGTQGFQIVKQETVVVGQERYAQSQKAYGEDQVSQRTQQQVAAEQTETSHLEQDVTEVHHEEGAEEYPDGYVAGSDTTIATGHASNTATTTTAASASHETEIGSVQGGESTSSVSGVRDVTEVRVTYVCGSQAAAPAPAP
jgi:hypothetical protein